MTVLVTGRDQTSAEQPLKPQRDAAQRRTVVGLSAGQRISEAAQVGVHHHGPAAGPRGYVPDPRDQPVMIWPAVLLEVGEQQVGDRLVTGLRAALAVFEQAVETVHSGGEKQPHGVLTTDRGAGLGRYHPDRAELLP